MLLLAARMTMTVDPFCNVAHPAMLYALPPANAAEAGPEYISSLFITS